MVRKRRKLEYEKPVTTVELESRLRGETGRRLRDRIEHSGPFPTEVQASALVEQATGFLAETLELSIDEARDVLIQDAATRRLTMTEAAQRILERET